MNNTRKCVISGCGWVSVGCGGNGMGMGFGSGFGKFTAGELAPVQRKEVFAKADRSFGRMDQFSRLGLAAITLALRDAGLEQWQEKRPIGVLAETASGCLYTDGDYFATVIPEQGTFASPQLFAYTLSNTFLGEAALRFGLTGNCQVINSGGDGGADNNLTVIQTAIESIIWGEDEKMVAGYCDLTTVGALGAPGAFFLVLENADDYIALNEKSAMATLHIDANGSICCNDQQVDNLAMLIEMLSSYA